MKQYVQHISGQGEKWEVLSDNCHKTEWRVKARTHEFFHDIPKSEYRLCDPPEEWEDASNEFKVTPSGGSLVKLDDSRILSAAEGYRLRKIDGMHNGPAFIIERRKP